MAKKNRRTNHKRRTYHTIFLDTLAELGGDKRMVAQTGLRNKLDWPTERYDRIKRELRDTFSVNVAAGAPGGLIGLTSKRGSKAFRIFTSYSHTDEEMKKRLVMHIKPLERLELISEWNDRELKAGDRLDEIISKNLEIADIVLCLVSVDFINSDYCYGKELARALELNDQGKARVIPIILKDCLWKHTPLGKLLALPKDGKAVSSWENQDQAFAAIAEEIRMIALDLKENT